MSFAGKYTIRSRITHKYLSAVAHGGGTVSGELDDALKFLGATGASLFMVEHQLSTKDWYWEPAGSTL